MPRDPNKDYDKLIKLALDLIIFKKSPMGQNDERIHFVISFKNRQNGLFQVSK